MDAGRSAARILIVPRPRTGLPERIAHRAGRTTIRTVRRVRPRTAQGVLTRVSRDVREPGWSLMTAAQALVTDLGGDPAPLRAARVQLLASALDRGSLSDTRALATIDVAIAASEGRRPSVRPQAR